MCCLRRAILGPRACAGAVGVGDSGGVIALSFGEVFEEVGQALLQGGATHREKRITSDRGTVKGLVVWGRMRFALSHPSELARRGHRPSRECPTPQNRDVGHPIWVG